MKYQDFNDYWYVYQDGKISEGQFVRLPHDAMLEEKRIPQLIEGAATGYFPGGKYIYEKTFFVEKALEGHTVMLEFEGIYQKSEVYINNVHAGGWIYGYTGFIVDVTKYLRYGEDNYIRVVADNSQTPNSRWYTGSGIYRPVFMLLGGKDYIVPDGIRVTTLSYKPARIQVDIQTSDDSVCQNLVYYDVLYEGKKIATGTGLHSVIEIPEVALWSEETPFLYELLVYIKKDEQIEDEARVTFGIRKLEWSHKEGLTCNGQTLKLKGACIHHDNGPLGACEFQDAAYRRIRILKETGYNAVRSSHNPISKELLKACDELGMYVMDETFDIWLTSKNPYDYSLYFEQEWKKDVTAIVKKDYNHPSVILYSIGNEISDIGSVHAIEIHKSMIELFRQLDSTRPVTNSINIMAALSAPKNKKKPIHKVSTEDIIDPKREASIGSMVGSKLINNIVTIMPFMISLATARKVQKNLKELMDSEDIVGYNYGNRIMQNLHDLEPNYLLLNTETFPKDIGKNWDVIKEENCYVGDFMWTGWDYLGEAGIGVPLYGTKKKKFNKPYPCIGAGIGSVNLIGDIEAQGYYAAQVWDMTNQPYIGVRPLSMADLSCQMGQWRGTDVIDSWTWPGYEGKTTQIQVFSQQKKVELFINGVSQGKKNVEDYMARFDVVYQPGTVRAISYDESGNETGCSILKTAQKENVLILNTDKELYKAGEDELIFVQIAMTDQNGILKQFEDKKIHVEVKGKGKLYRLGSGNPITEESYLDDAFSTYHGKLLAILRIDKEPGDVEVMARSEDGSYIGKCCCKVV